MFNYSRNGSCNFVPKRKVGNIQVIVSGEKPLETGTVVSATMLNRQSDQQEPIMEWKIPEEGFEFEPDTIVVSNEHQNEKLIACGLEASTFNGFVDASFYIGLGIHAGINNGISASNISPTSGMNALNGILRNTMT